MMMSCRITSSIGLARSNSTTHVGARALLFHYHNAIHQAFRTLTADTTKRYPQRQSATSTTTNNNNVDLNSSTASSIGYRSARPKRIILLRHGQSEGNVDASTYVTTPDWKVPLTSLGRDQALQAGKDISKILGGGQQGDKDDRVFIYYSPYLRTHETMELVRSEIGEDRVISLREEPRISEQQFGNFQNVEEVVQMKRERHDFGRFYYRMKNGEAGLDVYSRVSSFISTLVRDCDQYNKAGYDLDNITVVIVLHGLSLRLFLMRWFQFSVVEFEQSENPGNAQVVRMEKRCVGNHRWYEIDEGDRKKLNLPEHCGIPKKVDILNLNGLEKGF